MDNLEKLNSVDYEFVEVNGYSGLKILSGVYSGVIFQYENILMQEAENTVDSAVLSFGYNVISSEGIDDDVMLDYDFKQTIGDILLSILVNSVEQLSEEDNDFEFEHIDTKES